MARLSCIVAIIGTALICVLAKVEELYDDRYDNVDFMTILANDKLRNQYYNCFMGKEPCHTADAKYLKEVFSEAFQTRCRRCTEKQKVMLDVISDWYTKNRPDEWTVLVAKTAEDMKKKYADQ